MNTAIILIGSSQGGLEALEVLFRGMPVDRLPAVVLLLHRPGTSGRALRHLLERRLPFALTEPDDKEAICHGRFYLAPAGYHLLVERDTFHLSIDEEVSYVRPSIDVLFESAAFAYGPAAIGVILSGAGSDGAAGAAQMLDQGAVVLVQDPATAEAPSMPEAAIRACDDRCRVLTLETMGEMLARCRMKGRAS